MTEDETEEWMATVVDRWIISPAEATVPDASAA
jgi:hypothetical protein